MPAIHARADPLAPIEERERAMDVGPHLLRDVLAVVLRHTEQPKQRQHALGVLRVQVLEGGFRLGRRLLLRHGPLLAANRKVDRSSPRNRRIAA